MPRYQYTAIDASKKKTKGSITAESSYAARKQLRARGIHPTKITEAAIESNGKSLKNVFGKNKKVLVIEFTKQLSVLINSGIKLTESLTVLIQQTSDDRFKAVLAELRDRVMTGESFTEALADYGDYFDVIYISMVRVGEVTGTFGQTLATISAFMEKGKKVESKFITAMMYPIFLVIMCIVVVLILTTVVIPKIGAQIENTGQQLPWVTKALMSTSKTLTSYWGLIIAAGIVLFILVLRKLVQTERGKFIKDRFMISVPIIGPLLKQRVVARFTGTLSTLLRSGLPMAESLRIVAQVTGNSIMTRAIKQARDRILSGADIATPLRDSGVIDPAISYMVAVGERSGELETMLKNISDNLEEENDVLIDRMSAVIEPVIIVSMAAIVGVIAYAVLIPIIKFSAGL